MRNSLFVLVDCNNFYASCERVFEPSLENKPIVILSNNDGCVIARSNEAKAIGIEMGEPFFKCEYLIRRYNVKVFSSNFVLYGDMSQRVMNTLASFSPKMEVYSVDEAFLDLEGVANVTEYAYFIKQAIKKWIGIPVSIGIGPSKTLAKLANRLAKDSSHYCQHEGVLNICEYQNIDRLLQVVNIEDVWGIGRNFTKFLKRNYIRSAEDFKNAPDRWIKDKMGVLALRTAWELRGISCKSVEEKKTSRKSIISSRSFGAAVSELNELEEAIASFVSIAAEKLRSEALAASAIQVYLRTNKHSLKSRACSNSFLLELAEPSSYTGELIKAAHIALRRIFREGYLYKKAGVVLVGLVAQEQIQMNLFEQAKSNLENDQKKDQLMKIVDSINNQWGSKTIMSASAGTHKSKNYYNSRAWTAKQSHRSGCFTTRWGEIPIIPFN